MDAVYIFSSDFQSDDDGMGWTEEVPRERAERSRAAADFKKRWAVEPSSIWRNLARLTTRNAR